MTKNPIFVELGRRRAKTLTQAERSKGGILGAARRNKVLTKARRREIARKAAEVRWKKHGQA